MKLTKNETTLYEGIKAGMNEPGSGWLHEILGFIGWEDDHAAMGTLGSLVKKGLVCSEEDSEGPDLCHWVWIVE